MPGVEVFTLRNGPIPPVWFLPKWRLDCEELARRWRCPCGRLHRALLAHRTAGGTLDTGTVCLSLSDFNTGVIEKLAQELHPAFRETVR